MKKFVSKFRVALLAATFLILPALVTNATAGFAERSDRLLYGHDILNWGRNLDTCINETDSNKQCLILEGEMDPYKYSVPTMSKISIPESKNVQKIFAQDDRTKEWFIYDLKNNQEITRNTNYEATLEQWEMLGYSEPEFASESNAGKFFKEEFSSKISRITFEAFLFLSFFIPFLFLSLFIVLLPGSVLLFKEYRKTNKIMFLAAGTLLLLSWIVVTAIMIRFLSFL